MDEKPHAIVVAINYPTKIESIEVLCKTPYRKDNPHSIFKLVDIIDELGRLDIRINDSGELRSFNKDEALSPDFGENLPNISSFLDSEKVPLKDRAQTIKTLKAIKLRDMW